MAPASQRTLGPALLLSLLAALVFGAYFSQVANEFYLLGATTYDSGWFAYQLSHFDFPPANPPYLQDRGIPSFFAFHLAPLMPLWGALSELLRLSPPVAFGAYQGFFHALLLLLGAAVVRTPFSRGADVACRAAAGLALAFSPICLNAILFLHHELAMPILFIATCLALARDRPRLAATAFLLMLFVRTDAGFHAAMFFGAFAVAEWLRHRQVTRAARVTFTLAVIAFVYSVAAFAIVHFLFPQFDNFRYSYAGGDVFRHVSLPFLGDRVVNLLQKRPELYVFFGFVLGIGIARRNVHMVLGALAILPWTLLNLLAYRDVPGELYTYYAFPFLVLVAWPLLVWLLQEWAAGARDPRAPAVMDRGLLAGWGGMCVVALAAYFTLPFLADRMPAAERRAYVARFYPLTNVGAMREVSNVAGRIAHLAETPQPALLVDEAFLSLIPRLPREYAFKTDNGALPDAAPFVVAYFTTQGHAQPIQKLYLPRALTCFVLPRTNVRVIARDVPAETVRAMSPQLTDAPCTSDAFVAAVR